LENSTGDIIALLDSDAYPDALWLKKGVGYLENSAVGMLGGPSLTPPSDGISQKAGGYLLSSFVGSGSLAHRYGIGRITEVDDLPSCNLLVRRSVLERVQKDSPDVWPGEDTHLCRLVREMGETILYSPEVIVYHHRRPLFVAHLRQVWGYGLHRGYFARHFPDNSRRPIYFIPSIFLIGLVISLPLSILGIFNSIIMSLYTLYFLASLTVALRSRSLKMAGYIVPGLFLTHITYGLAFLKGILSKKIE